MNEALFNRAMINAGIAILHPDREVKVIVHSLDELYLAIKRLTQATQGLGLYDAGKSRAARVAGKSCIELNNGSCVTFILEKRR